MRFTPNSPLVIGTRGSPLALAQAHETMGRLIRSTGLDESCFKITVIKTSGDKIQDRPLSEVGGKGLFTKEIEDAMLDYGIDIAVHIDIHINIDIFIYWVSTNNMFFYNSINFFFI